MTNSINLRDRNNRDRPQESNASPVQEIIKHFGNKEEGLSNYEMRKLVLDANLLGTHLKEKNLKTTQVRKFLDAIKRIKTEMSVSSESQGFSAKLSDKTQFLRVQLAYAKSRHAEVEPFKRVMDEAIERVRDASDFERLVQLIEAIIAYHKAAGGRDQ